MSTTPSEPPNVYIKALQQASKASLSAAQTYVDAAQGFVQLEPYRRITTFGGVMIIAAVTTVVVSAAFPPFAFPLSMSFAMLIAGTVAIVVGALAEAVVGNAASRRMDSRAVVEQRQRLEIERQALLAGGSGPTPSDRET